MVEVIERIDELTQKKWQFWFHEKTLFLDSYYEEKRETKKHKFKSVVCYQRLFSRYSKIIESQVEIPDWVKKEAIKQFTEKITVKKWSEK